MDKRKVWHGVMFVALGITDVAAGVLNEQVVRVAPPFTPLHAVMLVLGAITLLSGVSQIISGTYGFSSIGDNYGGLGIIFGLMGIVIVVLAMTRMGDDVLIVLMMLTIALFSAVIAPGIIRLMKKQ